MRAAGEAAMISPDTAIAAFGMEAVSHAATAAVATVMKRVHDLHKHDPPSVRAWKLRDMIVGILTLILIAAAQQGLDADVLEDYVNSILKVR